MYEIRKLVAAQQGLRTSELSDLTKQAFQDIERGVGSYTWAFESEEDGQTLLRLSQSPHFKAYPRPERIEEAGVHILHSLFPSQCETLEELRGLSVCQHPHIGPRAGAGSVQTEAPRTIPRKQWLQAYGFGRGWLHLVQFTP